MQWLPPRIPLFIPRGVVHSIAAERCVTTTLVEHSSYGGRRDKEAFFRHALAGIDLAAGQALPASHFVRTMWEGDGWFSVGGWGWKGLDRLVMGVVGPLSGAVAPRKGPLPDEAEFARDKGREARWERSRIVDSVWERFPCKDQLFSYFYDSDSETPRHSTPYSAAMSLSIIAMLSSFPNSL
jgi:hypothetical protein